jgi:molybdopterin converting factor small subunit
MHTRHALHMESQTSMVIKVRLFASLARFSPGGLPGTTFEFKITTPTTVQDLLDQLHIPGEEIKVAFVNGLIRDMDWVLQPGDEVGIFPPIGGG